MTLEISAVDEAAPVPRQIMVQFSCDSPADLLCGERQIFRHAGGYIGCQLEAMKAGWLERHTDNGRIWLCPNCSGKPSGSVACEPEG